MDEDQGEAGQAVGEAQERTPAQVREEIEQTRAELGDTVAALAEKTDIKAQAKLAVDETKSNVSGKVSDIKDAVTTKKDDLVGAAQEATPDSAADAGQRATAFVKQNSVPLITIAAFSLGLLIGRRRGR